MVCLSFQVKGRSITLLALLYVSTSSVELLSWVACSWASLWAWALIVTTYVWPISNTSVWLSYPVCCGPVWSVSVWSSTIKFIWSGCLVCFQTADCSVLSTSSCFSLLSHGRICHTKVTSTLSNTSSGRSAATATSLLYTYLSSTIFTLATGYLVFCPLASKALWSLQSSLLLTNFEWTDVFVLPVCKTEFHW